MSAPLQCPDPTALLPQEAMTSFTGLPSPGMLVGPAYGLGQHSGPEMATSSAGAVAVPVCAGVNQRCQICGDKATG
ncbi:unnamed protein product [Protopolystoma xenopodis]|uniref:Uncharacterized protein n=1 Tax=Protopolystoma xenopodis TaxID=117903 RepID=A0A3S5FD93_9PLAT|nr:unnamed protein product [Protopolystoma xenopodis]